MLRTTASYIGGIGTGTLVHAAVLCMFFWHHGFESATNYSVLEKLADLALMVGLMSMLLAAATIAWACVPFFVCYVVLCRLRVPSLGSALAAAVLAGGVSLLIFVEAGFFLADDAHAAFLQSYLEMLPCMTSYSVVAGLVFWIIRVRMWAGSRPDGRP